MQMDKFHDPIGYVAKTLLKLPQPSLLYPSQRTRYDTNISTDDHRLFDMMNREVRITILGFPEECCPADIAQDCDLYADAIYLKGENLTVSLVLVHDELLIHTYRNHRSWAVETMTAMGRLAVTHAFSRVFEAHAAEEKNHA